MIEKGYLMSLLTRERPENLFPKETLLPPDIKLHISYQAQHPTNKDKVVQAFYAAILDRIQFADHQPLAKEAETDDKVVRALMLAYCLREPKPSAQLFTNLLFRAYQFTVMKTNTTGVDFEYTQFFDSTSWYWEFERFFNTPTLRDCWINTMLTKTTSTTILRRYAGIKALLAYRFGDMPISVIDVGCGLNYGLRGLELNVPFEGINDKTPDRLVNRLISQPIDLTYGIGIDTIDSTREDETIWNRACRYLPKEHGQIPNDIALERRLTTDSRNVKFVRGDFMDPNIINNIPKVDVVILSTVLYQSRDREQHMDFLLRALKKTRPEGMVIAQDFAIPDRTNPHYLDLGVDWYANHNYRTFVYRPFEGTGLPDYPQEVLKWDGGRCKEVLPGRDFDKFFRMSS